MRISSQISPLITTRLSVPLAPNDTKHKQKAKKKSKAKSSDLSYWSHIPPGFMSTGTVFSLIFVCQFYSAGVLLLTDAPLWVPMKSNNYYNTPKSD